MRSKTIVLQQEAKIFFYRNTTSPAAHFLSTIAHKQCQILLLSPQAQIKENITMSSEANISKVLFENPCIMWAGIYSNPIWLARKGWQGPQHIFWEVEKENLFVIWVWIRSKYKSMNQNP